MIGRRWEPSDLRQIVQALRESLLTVLSAAGLASIVAGIGDQALPLAAQPVWEAREGRGCFFVFEGLDRSGQFTPVGSSGSMS